MRVCHVTSGLSVGGAQRMLAKLLASDAFDPGESTVVSLVDGPMRFELEQLGVQVSAVADRKALAYNPLSLGRLRTLVRESDPRLVQGWMYHGNLASTIVGGIPGLDAPVLWNVRHSLHAGGREAPLTKVIIRLAALVSWAPRRIIYNSETSRRQHEALGFSVERSVVIPNGFDTTRFRPGLETRREVRDELEIPHDALVVGHVARFHPMKDHDTAFRAASIVSARMDRARFVFVGEGVREDNPSISSLLDQYSPRPPIRLLGGRTDVSRLMTAFDVFFLSSAWGEAFPNVLGEAMASGVPCVTTNLGDASEVVGDTGFTAPPRDPVSLAECLVRVLEMPRPDRDRLGRAARERVEREYTLASVAAQYREVYERVLAREAEAEPGAHP